MTSANFVRIDLAGRRKFPIMRANAFEGVLVITALAVVLILVTMTVLWDIAVFRECAASEPWWYCLRLLGR